MIIPWPFKLVIFICLYGNTLTQSMCGLVAMTPATHAEGRQFDPGQMKNSFTERMSAHRRAYYLSEPSRARLRSRSDTRVLNNSHSQADAGCREKSCRNNAARFLSLEMGRCDAAVV